MDYHGLIFSKNWSSFWLCSEEPMLWLYLESQTLLQVALAKIAKRLNPQSGFRGGIASNMMNWSNMPNGVGSPSPVYLQSMAKLQRAVPLLGQKPRMLLALAQCIGNLATTIATIELPPGTLRTEDGGCQWQNMAKLYKKPWWVDDFLTLWDPIVFRIQQLLYIYIRNYDQIYTYICSYTVSYINHIYISSCIIIDYCYYYYHYHYHYDYILLFLLVYVSI